jgi:5-hydroxyisourate hydrolase
MISTHVLDISIGKPAANIPVDLEYLESDKSWTKKFSAKTNQDGRIAEMIADKSLIGPGTYRLTFNVQAYFKNQGFYPFIQVIFLVQETLSHYHVPILLSPYGYSTYRGS